MEKQNKSHTQKIVSQNKGITLIALIITIVVLLILAVVAIQSIQNDGILAHAENAAKTYNKAVEDEQDMLSYYEGYLAGTLWEQNGTAVTKKNADGTTTILAVGDSVTVKVGDGAAEAYSANGNSSWKVLGAEGGKLLLVTTSNVSSVALGGKEGGDIYGDGSNYVAGYNNGVAYLNGVCDDYLNPTYASEARSIKVEDLNRITKYNPTQDANYKDYYGKQYTYTSSFEHPSKGTASETNPITETYTYYYYSTSSSDIGEAAYNLLFDDYYWLASSYVDADSSYAYFGLRYVCYDIVDGYDLWGSYGSTYISGGGVRAVVSLKSNVTVAKAS